jgi:hypothetical protein
VNCRMEPMGAEDTSDGCRGVEEEEEDEEGMEEVVIAASEREERTKVGVTRRWKPSMQDRGGS